MACAARTVCASTASTGWPARRWSRPWPGRTTTVTIKVQPLLGLPVIKDLVVDMEPFFEHYRSVMPFFVSHELSPERERLQSPGGSRPIIDDGTKCILCACCTTSCPSFLGRTARYVGPAAIVQAHRFIFDSRDTAGQGAPEHSGCTRPVSGAAGPSSTAPTAARARSTSRG